MANEQLQFYFNQHVFAWEQVCPVEKKVATAIEMPVHLCSFVCSYVCLFICLFVCLPGYVLLQEEYEREGINVTQVGYRDNRPLLELLLSVSACDVMSIQHNVIPPPLP